MKNNKNDIRVKDLCLSRKRLCLSYKFFFENMNKFEGHGKLIISMNLLNTFDKSIWKDENLTDEERRIIFNTNEDS